ncbi:MAG: glycosyltransferase [Intestinibacillus sp.]
MKVLLYSGHLNWIYKSGVGRAIRHQRRALESAGVPYTTDPKDDCDIVHINTIFPSSYLLAKKARRQGKRVVYHAHSTQEDFRNSFLFSNQLAPLFKKWISACYRTGDLILTPTPYSRSLLEGYGLGRPVVSVSNGIDLDYFSREQADGQRFREKYNIKAGEKAIISVGLFLERKGILEFVDMAKRLPQYRFIWFGETDLRTVPAAVRRAVRTRLPNLTFAGYVESDALRDAYAGCDLYWFPTHEETEGIVLLEALAMRAPTLIRAIPIYEGWLRHGANVYKGVTQEDFARLIRGIVEKELPDLTNAAYEIACERSIAEIGRQLRRQYEAVLSQPQQAYTALRAENF